MTSPFNNLWAETLLEQMWLVRQTTDVMAKTLDAELMLDAQALSDYCLEPTQERLNPLEFHGKRRSVASPRPPAGETEGRAAARARQGRRIC